MPGHAFTGNQQQQNISSTVSDLSTGFLAKHLQPTLNDRQKVCVTCWIWAGTEIVEVWRATFFWKHDQRRKTDLKSLAAVVSHIQCRVNAMYTSVSHSTRPVYNASSKRSHRLLGLKLTFSARWYPRTINPDKPTAEKFFAKYFCLILTGIRQRSSRPLSIQWA